MTQWFRGQVEGLYVGLPDRAGALGASQVGRGYRLLVYRAAIRNVELLEFTPPAPATSVVDTAATASDVPVPSTDVPTAPDDAPAAPDDGATGASEPPAPPAPLVLPPWLPAPGTAFFQASLTDARLFPIRHNSGWFEGPIHQVFIEDFTSTHTKMHGSKLYGKFTGRIQAYFELPPAPLPVAAERIIQAFQDLPEEELPPEPARPPRKDAAATPAEVRSAEAPSGALSPSAGPTPGPTMQSTTAPATSTAATETTTAPTAAAKDTNATTAAPTTAPSSSARRNRVPFLILVVLVAFALLLTCGAPRALLWLFFLLPTLLVRRILREIVPDTMAVRGVSALLTLGQVWLAGMVFVGWWETGCRDVHAVPLVGTLIGLFLVSALPSDVPLLVNASSLAALLLGWCTGNSECGVAANQEQPYGPSVVACATPSLPAQVTSPAVTDSSSGADRT